MKKRHWTAAVENFIGHRIRTIGLIIVVIVILGLSAGILRFWTDPDINILINEGGAEWIRFPKPFRLAIYWSGNISTSFRYHLDIQDTSKEALLTFRAMKKADVYLDGQLIYQTSVDLARWKETHRLNLAKWLQPGKHELRIDVSNWNGHPALIAYGKSAGIWDGTVWEASTDGRKWVSALPVNQIPPLRISRRFPRSDQAIRPLIPFFLAIFTLIFFCSLRSDAHFSPPRLKNITLSASTVRWLVLGSWLLMALNNFRKLPLTMGMDANGHLQYINYLVENARIPLATEGWQMFQSPLYYLLAAAVYQTFLPLFSADTVIRIVKLLSIICGMIQVEICYRTLRIAYPGKVSLQVIGILLGGLLPMNLYMSQSLGNEPLVGALISLLILVVYQVFSGVRRESRETFILMGFILGLALLTKVTAILIVPPLLLFLSAEIIRRREAPGEGIRSVARFGIIVFCVALTVSGWYYLQNWIEMDRFFVGGWDAMRNIVWWQDPGYRTLRQCYIFGESILYPIFSSIYGFWDSIYSSFWSDGFMSAYDSPPWNYGFMLSGALLSILPSTAILIGFAVTAFVKNGTLCRMLRFSACSIFFYMAAIFYMFLTVPILSSAKATYTLGLTPCFAIMGTVGFEIMTRNCFIKAVVYGLFACWVVGSFASYFVI